MNVGPNWVVCVESKSFRVRNAASSMQCADSNLGRGWIPELVTDLDRLRERTLVSGPNGPCYGSGATVALVALVTGFWLLKLTAITQIVKTLTNKWFGGGLRQQWQAEARPKSFGEAIFFLDLIAISGDRHFFSGGSWLGTVESYEGSALVLAARPKVV